MKPKQFTKEDIEHGIGLEYFISTKTDIYNGEILAVNDEFVTVEYFNTIKDSTREIDIPLKDILWLKEDL